MTCTQCGAAVKQGDGRFCSHCGAALPDRPRITPEEWVTHRERFEQAANDPQHAIAMGLPVPDPRLGAKITPIAIFGAIWIVMCLFMTSQFAAHAGAMAIAPLAIGVFGVVAMGSIIARAARRARAPVERAIGVVIDERTQISTTGMGDDRSTHTAYYATLQFQDGARRELETSGGVTGMTTRGDIGLAVMRGGELIDFHRFSRV